MITELISVSEDTSINQAIDLMKDKNLHRIPVVKDGKLVGLITKGLIAKKTASDATTLEVFELNYLLEKMKVGSIMEKKLITINGAALLEDAASLMLSNDIGCLPVITEDNTLVGIITQNDLLASFLDILGYSSIGSRLEIEVTDRLGVIGEISKILVNYKVNTTHIGVYTQPNNKYQLVYRIDSIASDELINELNSNGFKVTSVSKNIN
ncbi:MAG: CBS and ACT domain-containing protein, partial [Erysipelotrichaceae bacterium]